MSINDLIRVSLTADGDIEAALWPPQAYGYDRVLIDRRTGDLIESNTKEGTNIRRWLLRAARQHINHPRPEEYR